jgi:4-hydroxy-4-methyl-2-oxoglutarate aldolase
VTATRDERSRAARDAELVRRLERLYTAVVSDCLDAAGLRNQVMAERVRPLYPDACLAGYAATLELVLVDSPPADPRDNYKQELQAVASLQPEDVVVASTCHGSFWGELLATASRANGARGVVADAYTRDSAMLIEMGFPTFVAGINAQDSLGRLEVASMGSPIACGGVSVDAGDLILADHDGVVVVPRAAADEVIAEAEEKVRQEDGMREALQAGMPVTEAFKRFKIL